MAVNRRKFLGGTVSGTLGVAAGCAASWSTNIPAAMAQVPNSANLQPLSAAGPTVNQPGPIFVATWPFGKPACETAIEVIQAGGSALDALQAGIGLVEADVSNPSVGIGGIPNALGQVELDACIMAGPGHRAGAVAALQGVLHPLAVARRVMEQTPHVMLVGEGAQKFAREQGFELQDLLTDEQRELYEKWKLEKQLERDPSLNSEGESAASTPWTIDSRHHDTIAMLGMDPHGDLFGGCSTSGWGYKLPGRVGDSPIIGAGLYVDNRVGAAGATGLGENVMRFCGSFLVVEFMRNGAEPTEACRLAIQRVSEVAEMPIEKLDVNFIALSKSGKWGSAGTTRGFEYAVGLPAGTQVLPALPLSDKLIGPEGGNRR